MTQLGIFSHFFYSLLRVFYFKIDLYSFGIYNEGLPLLSEIAGAVNLLVSPPFADAFSGIREEFSAFNCHLFELVLHWLVKSNLILSPLRLYSFPIEIFAEDIAWPYSKFSMLFEIFAHGLKVSFIEIRLGAWTFDLFENWSDEVIWVKKSLKIALEVWRISNATSKF